MPPVRQEMLQLFLENLVKAGVLSPGSSPWGFPLLMAKKPGRDPTLPQSYRLLADFRRLNELVLCPSTPLPLIDDILVGLVGSGNKLFSLQDLTNGFFCVRLDKSSQRMCTIISPTGQAYQFLRLPQGLRSSPSFFSQLMVSVFGPLRTHSRVYIDDAITATVTEGEMIDALVEVWTALFKAGLKLKPHKCFYGRRQLDILGWHIDGQGRRPQTSKLKALKEMASPTSIKEVQSLVGLFNYYRDHIHRYADVSHPLVSLLGLPKGTPYVWSPECETAMRKVIEDLCQAFILQHAGDGELRIYTDASDKGLSGVLVEYPIGTNMDPMAVDGPLPCEGKVLGFCSKRFSAAESRYAIPDRELLAIVYAVEHFHSYLNRKFQVVTDHGALAFWKSINSTTSSRLQRYAMYLSKYCMDLVYREGPLNVVADPISRLLKVHHDVGQQRVHPHPAVEVLGLRSLYRVPVCAQAMSLEYSRDASVPLAVVTPVVGSTVAVRLSQEPWLRRITRKTLLTNADRYGIIRSVYKNKTVRVEFGSGACLSVSLNKLQQIPLADYFAALSTEPDAGVTEKFSLAESLLEAQQADPEVADFGRWSTLDTTRKEFLSKLWEVGYNGTTVVPDPISKLWYRMTATGGRTLLVPAPLRASYMRLAHAALVLGAHRSSDATREALQPWVYWPGMRQDIIEHCKTCHVCQTHSKPHQAHEFPVGSLAVFHPLQRISVDHVGPLTESASGNKYLLVAIDHFTKYVWVFPVKDTKTHTTALVLWSQLFAVFGTPEEILTDGAPQLLAKELTDLYKLFHIEPLQSTAYYPKGNSVVERANQTVNATISKALSELEWKADWDEVSSMSAYSYNQALHRSTGYSPFFLMFGRDVRSPFDLLLRANEEDRSLEQYILHLLRALQTSHAAVRDRLLQDDAARQALNKTRSGDEATLRDYHVGDLVLWRRGFDSISRHDARSEVDHEKHFADWSGPNRVVAIHGATTYEIEMVAARGDFRIASALQLRHYYARSEENPLPDILIPPTVSAVSAAVQVHVSDLIYLLT